ncbi:13586_t:CDS:2 [Funneliformis mosseae]|uniref:13586_t:CDS:1 n=1 Tax=Funneliformis mosseae TaxID=27381 RepID=A0A9N9EYI9_FUNMO|nr:13586_t:CDS:2 [Funneliformis mosseae]
MVTNEVITIVQKVVHVHPNRFQFIKRGTLLDMIVKVSTLEKIADQPKVS